MTDEIKSEDVLPWIKRPEASLPPKASMLLPGEDVSMIHWGTRSIALSAVPQKIEQLEAERDGALAALETTKKEHKVTAGLLGTFKESNEILRASNESRVKQIEALKKEIAKDPDFVCSKEAFNGLVKERAALMQEVSSLKSSAARMELLGKTYSDKDAEVMRLQATIAKLQHELESTIRDRDGAREALQHANKLLLAKEGIGEAPQLGVLEEAEQIVNGARQAQYGPPERSFDLIATLWTSYLQTRDEDASYTLDGRDVCLLMILMKIARDIGGNAKRDNLVDIAGYVRCAEIIEKTLDDQIEAVKQELAGNDS
jgi:Domain of unknown function (DUF6378)